MCRHLQLPDVAYTLEHMTDGCVFCAIVAGAAPAERIYEDASVIAIMDLHPAVPGHVLVIPRHHSPDLWHIEPADAAQTMAASVQVAGMIRRALGPDGINLVHASGRAAWQTVFHFHLHLVPRYEGDGLVPPWPLGQPRAEAASLRAVAEKLRSASEDSGTGA